MRRDRASRRVCEVLGLRLRAVGVAPRRLVGVVELSGGTAVLTGPVGRVARGCEENPVVGTLSQGDQGFKHAHTSVRRAELPAGRSGWPVVCRVASIHR